MKFTENRRRRTKLAAGTLVLAGIATTAGCTVQAAPASLAATSAPSAQHSSALRTPPAVTFKATEVPSVSASPATTKSRSVTAGVKECPDETSLTRPAELNLACADAGLWAEDLVWSSWSATSATATGIFTWHDCTPNCAESTKWGTSSAQFTLTDPVAGPGDQVLFTELEMHVTGPTPPGFKRVTTFGMFRS